MRVGGAWLVEFSPTALLVSSENSGSVHRLVLGLNINGFLDETVNTADLISFWPKKV